MIQVVRYRTQAGFSGVRTLAKFGVVNLARVRTPEKTDLLACCVRVRLSRTARLDLRGANRPTHLARPSLRRAKCVGRLL